VIGVFATFRYGDNFDERAVRKIAETARARFEGMPGLRSTPESVRPRTFTFGSQRTRLKRSSPVSFSSE